MEEENVMQINVNCVSEFFVSNIIQVTKEDHVGFRRYIILNDEEGNEICRLKLTSASADEISLKFKEVLT